MHISASHFLPTSIASIGSVMLRIATENLSINQLAAELDEFCKIRSKNNILIIGEWEVVNNERTQV